MKFGKSFEKALEEDKIPQSWIVNSIQYKHLKKKINLVVHEMHDIGLTHDYINENHLHLYYTFNEKSNHLKPLLQEEEEEVLEVDGDIEVIDSHIDEELQQPLQKEPGNFNVRENKLIRYKLQSDEEFFQSLYSQYLCLKKFNLEQQSIIIKKISSLADIITNLTTHTNIRFKNFKNSDDDMYLWREIFNLYIEFKLDLNSNFNIKNLNKFCNHINDIGILKRSKHSKANTKIFQSFYDLNLELIKYLSFENLNNIAMRKIIKKFDKNTLLKSSTNFTKLVMSNYSNGLQTYTIEQVLSTKVIKLIPQLDDYTCPICFSLAYKPIRLECHHFFCLRCMIKLQRKGEEKCPICRDPVVMKADETNVDEELIELMKQHFPKELKLKKKETGKEITDEAIKELYGDEKCTIM